MPAVHMARLKSEIASLLAHADDPERFAAAISELLERYADRTYRATENVRLLVPQYHVPALALRQLEIALAGLSQARPDAALRLADRMWEERYLEPRSLAASLIGRLPGAYSAQVVERLREWCTPAEDRLIVDAMLASGSASLRSQSPEKWFDLARGWLEREEVEYRLLGLRAVRLLVEDQRYENLPAVYTLTAAVLEGPIGPVQAELASLLQALARRSPVETAFFLRQMISSQNRPELSRIARRCLPLLPDNAQASLRPLLIDRQR